MAADAGERRSRAAAEAFLYMSRLGLQGRREALWMAMILGRRATGMWHKSRGR